MPTASKNNHRRPPRHPHPVPTPVEPPHYERFVVSFDPLGALSDRCGAILETTLSSRDAVTLSPWSVTGKSTGSPDLAPGLWASNYTVYDVHTRALGLDLQYRHYFGSHLGARGLFIAPGFVEQPTQVRARSSERRERSRATPTRRSRSRERSARP